MTKQTLHKLPLNVASLQQLAVWDREDYPSLVVHLMLFTVVNVIYHGILMVHMCCFIPFLDHNSIIYSHVERHCVFYGLGGKLLLEINRILRPGGYFIISSRSADLESEEGMIE
jgi:SAM-dependent methyltransferase